MSYLVLWSLRSPKFQSTKEITAYSTFQCLNNHGTKNDGNNADHEKRIVADSKTETSRVSIQDGNVAVYNPAAERQRRHYAIAVPIRGISDGEEVLKDNASK